MPAGNEEPAAIPKAEATEKKKKKAKPTVTMKKKPAAAETLSRVPSKSFPGIPSVNPGPMTYGKFKIYTDVTMRAWR
eukprot:1413764-Karenia_brevis.AAC.1